MKYGINRALKMICLVALAGKTLSAPERMQEYALPVVTSDLDVAALCGYNVMGRGGNAVDAAVATAIAVGAINSFASGLGGGGFLLLKLKDGKCFEYNFRERAPGSARKENYKVQEDSRSGRKSIAIPSELMGLLTVHMDYGRLPWKDLFLEIVGILRTGFRVQEVLAKKLKEFEHIIVKDAGLRETFFREGRLVRENEVVKRENLARTLEVLSENPWSFYTGEVADSLLSFINAGEEYITREELRGIPVIKKEVFPEVIGESVEVYTPGLPTMGWMIRIGVAVIKQLKDAGVDMSREKTLQENLMVVYNELYRIRAELDDLQDEKANQESLIKHSEQSRIVQKITEKILKKNRFIPYLKKPLEDHGTTHINVIDRDGMMVSLTSTINQYWGSGLMDPQTGIILNNQIDDFTFTGFQNSSGISSFCRNKNGVQPYKQPLSSTMPSILRMDSDFYILGSSGGIRIPTAVISTLSRTILCKNSIEDAISHPRLHYQGGDTIKVEHNYRDPLPDLGIKWKVLRDSADTISSCVHIIKYSLEKRTAQAAADKRKGAAVVGAPLKHSPGLSTVFNAFTSVPFRKIEGVFHIEGIDRK
ncbi:gamma-glutamyltranspeptidase / glutathione hydrolase / leukotriene-C4 hydrolase [Nematocida major]|uniref:gamma-glutamyltranspeptidase / glutathione hydrolase / leukotriene-C4 hydrolase n=1 Tax=Nematocida major TaxID=1912982 RepID=UPI002007303C|nr:gamma-glutamyltranspeptidase / glutathione hydrolase / leukotriene-C4 hydrolase [Nematocida major]KAH9387286.1 gamma-glutamyltranspeptidase / glutathione hydrolase / leukotriene-C4 hydrolase [Nematocida major]